MARLAAFTFFVYTLCIRQERIWSYGCITKIIVQIKVIGHSIIIDNIYVTIYCTLFYWRKLHSFTRRKSSVGSGTSKLKTIRSTQPYRFSCSFIYLFFDYVILSESNQNCVLAYSLYVIRERLDLNKICVVAVFLFIITKHMHKHNYVFFACFGSFFMQVH